MQIPFTVQALFIGGPIFCIIIYAISIKLVKDYTKKKYDMKGEDRLL
jgi:hypothetical protein